MDRPTPADAKERLVRTYARNVRSDARWSRATEPVFRKVSETLNGTFGVTDAATAAAAGTEVSSALGWGEEDARADGPSRPRSGLGLGLGWWPASTLALARDWDRVSLTFSSSPSLSSEFGRVVPRGTRMGDGRRPELVISEDSVEGYIQFCYDSGRKMKMGGFRYSDLADL
jgi:hypothetical protein